MWAIGPRVRPQLYHRCPYPQPRNKVASLVVISAGCCSLHRCSHPIAVILTDENTRQFPQSCHIVSFKYRTLEVQIKSSSGFIVLFSSQLHHPPKPLLYPARESPQMKCLTYNPDSEAKKCVCVRGVVQQTHLFLHLRKWQAKYFYLLLWLAQGHVSYNNNVSCSRTCFSW